MSKVHHLLTIKKGNPISLIGFPLHFKTQTLFQSFGDKSLQFLSSQIFSYNTIIFIQHEDRRNSINIVFLYHVALPSFQIRKMQPSQPVFLDCLHPLILFLIQGDTDHGQTFIFKFSIQFHHIRVLHPTRPTPRCPEINDLQFPFHTIQGNVLPLRCL